MNCPFQGKECDPETCAIGVSLDRGDENEELVGCAFAAMAESLWDIAVVQAEAVDLADEDAEEAERCLDDEECACPACKTMTEDDEHEIEDGEDEN
jgi:hypothetical protein